MKIILTAIYGMAVALVMLCGWFYLVILRWSYLAAGVFVLHGILSLIVAARRIADAGKIAAWYWHGLSSLISAGLLLAFVLRDEGGWFLAAAALTAFTLIVTLIFALILKPDGIALQASRFKQTADQGK